MPCCCLLMRGVLLIGIGAMWLFVDEDQDKLPCTDPEGVGKGVRTP